MMGISDKMTGNFNGERFSSTGNERETPWHFFWRLDDEFHFTLDPCASHKNHKCERYFTKTMNGLKQDWSDEVVFVNPPYGRELKDWAKKGYEESLKGATVVVLIPLRANNIWWHDYCMKAHEIRLLKKRLKFLDIDGVSFSHGLPYPLALVIYRPEPHEGYPKLSSYEAYHSSASYDKGGRKMTILSEEPIAQDIERELCFGTQSCGTEEYDACPEADECGEVHQKVKTDG